MAEIVGLVVACVEVLEATFETVQRITTALERIKERNKNGFKTLDSVCAQVAITKQILKNIVQVDEEHHTPLVYASVELVKQKACNLKAAAEEFGSPAENKFKAFLNELIRGDARLKTFDRMQVDLIMAQSTLITSLVAHNYVQGTTEGTVDINISIVERVNNFFKPDIEVNYARQILNLVGGHGEPIDDGIVCTVKAQDLEKLMQDVPQRLPGANGKIVRILNHNHVEDWGMVTVDIGSPGEGTPHVDSVTAEFNVVSGNGFCSAGPMSYNTASKTQALRASLKTVEGNQDAALKMLEATLPDFKS
ncbi:uncharacterized protein BDZ83DRAFT_758892 [Colletotrichum acutatum]|uniref:Uncharacterized protein n=1 Tax=Glomerella acutata TaxID=27357 RepID=A0AAD8U965_GLOAC|nr:uncharacterized protein BDZ83DRAFT_758892 [Colletotrichum acutatum]KAK1703433.1 hypothetical protein BDZ83DRAFT_758892 [Colletotrichum acutatum]